VICFMLAEDRPFCVVRTNQDCVRSKAQAQGCMIMAANATEAVAEKIRTRQSSLVVDCCQYMQEPWL